MGLSGKGEESRYPTTQKRGDDNAIWKIAKKLIILLLPIIQHKFAPIHLIAIL